MGELNRMPNVAQPDEMYELFIALHEGCDEAESHKRNAKLILALANHIGDLEVVREAARLAKASS